LNGIQGVRGAIPPQFHIYLEGVSSKGLTPFLVDCSVCFWPTTDIFCAPTFNFLTEQLEFNRKTANDP